jgi:hypothetical protein
VNKFCTRLGKALDGLKALLGGAAMLLLTLGDYFQVIPIQPLMEHYFGVENSTPIVLCWAILISSIRYALGKKEPFHSDDAFNDPEAQEPF